MRKKTTLVILAFMVTSTIFSVIPAIATEDETIHPFVYATGSSPEGIDPLGAYDTSSGLVIQNVLESLFSVDYSDPAMPITPLLAEDMGTWNEDNDVWTVNLRDDVTFHNGQKFNATTVWWNFYRLNYLSMTGANEHASLWFNDVVLPSGNKQLILNHTEIVSEFQVKFHLNKAWLDFKELLPFWGASMLVYDPYYTYQILEMNHINWYFGTGPFVLDSITIQEKVVLVANDDYYQGRPELDQVILAVYPSTIAADQALLNQEVHAIRSLYYTNLELADADPDVQYQKVKSACCYFFHLQVDRMPWAARKAVQWGFNYTYMIEQLYAGTTFEHHSPVPDGMWGYNGDIPGLPYYDLDVARAFILDSSEYETAIDDAGLSASSSDADWIAVADSATPLDVFNFTHYGLTSYFTMLKDNMRYLGFEISNNLVGDWPSFLNYVQSNDALDITMGGWCPDYFAAVNQIEPLYASGASSNWNKLNNATIDAWMAELHQMPQGEAKQDKIDRIVKAIIVEQAASMYFQQSAEYIAYSSLFIDPDSVGDLFNSRLDKYFYNLKWQPGIWDEQTTGEEKPGIPGYTTGMMMAVALGAAAILILRKRK